MFRIGIRLLNWRWQEECESGAKVLPGAYEDMSSMALDKLESGSQAQPRPSGVLCAEERLKQLA